MQKLKVDSYDSLSLDYYNILLEKPLYELPKKMILCKKYKYYFVIELTRLK